MNLPSATLSTLLQVVLFGIVPSLTYLVTRRRWRGFAAYVGLVRPDGRPLLYATLLIVVIAPASLAMYFIPELRAIGTGPNTPTGQLASLEFSPTTVAIVLLLAFIQTGFCEELFFRGFIGKRLIARIGFTRGNLLQALLFASVHSLVFLVEPITPLTVLLFAVYPTITGWVFGWLTERVGNGSIVPSWWLHGASNALAYSFAVVS